MRVYREVRPDIGVVLDYPISPMHTPRQMRKRWKMTLANTKWMMQNDGLVDLMPVVHGYDESTLQGTSEDILSLGVPTVVGLGSLVPLIKRSRIPKSLQRKWGTADQFLERAVSVVSDMFPNSMLHVFGVGSLRSMRLVLSAGADSLDTISWRKKAANGAIVIPGGVDRFVTPRGRRVGLSREDKGRLRECSCPICDGRSLGSSLRLLDNDRPRTFYNRATHNAHVIRTAMEKLV
jgi:tRNA-guanine family transglycosylase